MYVECGTSRISAAKLSEESGSGTSWIVGGSSSENLAKDDVIHESLGEVALSSSSCAVSKECLDVAREMAETLQGATLPASENDTTGRVVVFVDEEASGLPSIETCMNALGLKSNVDGRDLRAEMNITAMDWSECKGGFCREDDYIDDFECEDDLSTDDQKIIATTKLMASELTDHFEYNMTERIVCGPVLYGGRKGKAIIAVLSMRVWT